MSQSENYEQLISRNIGLLTEDQQETLKNSRVAVLGLGGLGGVIAEILARSGIGSLTIADNDKFVASNLNRQVFAFQESLGRLKTDVTEEFLKRINPGIHIRKFTDVTTSSIQEILAGVDVAVLAIDTLEPCIIISRAARGAGVTLVEGWALPFGNVRVFTKHTPSLEEVYQLPTLGREIDSISSEEVQKLSFHLLESLKKIEGIEPFYPPRAVARILSGEIPSFAPLVWLTAVLMSLEAIKVILGWGKISLAPNFALYNPFENSIPHHR